MRHGVCLILFGAVILGFAPARASGAGTTTTETTTTTAATTTTATPSYAGLATSSLSTSCVGAGAAAIVPPAHSVIAVGTPGSSLGPSGYPGSASVVAFASSSVSGSGCAGTTLILTSVSLFGGAVTAASVAATGGRGTVAGLEIDGAPVSVGAGAVAVDGWGLLTFGDSFGRLTAPLVLLLTQAHDGLVAGTRIALAFAAAPRPVATPSPSRQASPGSRSGPTTPANSGADGAKSLERHAAKAPPDFPASTNPFMAGDPLPDGAQDNPVVSTAMRYLGVRYQWGGASPQTGFDCSGLVTYVFGQLGVSLPHYAAAQWYSPDSVWVSPHHLQAGDLVFFTGADGTRKAPGHVGIYVGDGYLIDAPHSGSFVQIDSLHESWFANEYVGARRIVSQLLHTRRQLHQPEASAGGILLDFPSPLRIDPMGESLQVAAAAAPGASFASGASLTWGGGALGGLLVLLMAGGLVFRRRRGPAVES